MRGWQSPTPMSADAIAKSVKLKGLWSVRDLDSSNGTSVNDKLIQEVVLKPGHIADRRSVGVSRRIQARGKIPQSG